MSDFHSWSKLGFFFTTVKRQHITREWRQPIWIWSGANFSSQTVTVVAYSALHLPQKLEVRAWNDVSAEFFALPYNKSAKPRWTALTRLIIW